MAFAVAACGGSAKGDPRVAVKSYLHAMTGREYGTACGRLSEDAKRDLVRLLVLALPPKRAPEALRLADDCERLSRQVGSLLGRQIADASRSRVVDVKLAGGGGDALVTTVAGTWRLHAEGRRWQISKLGLELGKPGGEEEEAGGG